MTTSALTRRITQHVRQHLADRGWRVEEGRWPQPTAAAEEHHQRHQARQAEKQRQKEQS